MQHLNPEETRSCKCCQDYDEINNILGDDSGENFKAKIAKIAKYANGEPDDSDFEFQAGEMQLYDSAVHEIDELLFWSKLWTASTSPSCAKRKLRRLHQNKWTLLWHA